MADTPELRAAYNAALPKVSELFTRHAADERLYAKYKALASSPQAATLNPARKRVLSNAMRDFVLSGAELQGATKERFAAIQNRLSELGQAFSEHVLDATDAFAYHAEASELDGVPQDVLAATRSATEAEGKDGHKLTLQMPVYLPVMQYAHDRALRERLYIAYVTRACEVGPAALDNTAVMRRDPRAAAGGGRAARLSERGRDVAGAQDGPQSPTRCWPSCATSVVVRARMPSAIWPNCAPLPPPSSVCPIAELGHGLCVAKSSSRRATPSATTT